MTLVEGVAITDSWLRSEPIQTLFDLLEGAGGEAMVAGGAVRNSLMGLSVRDVDVATTLLPHDVIASVEAGGHKAVPTGIEHGTVTVVVSGASFEVTTLRQDIETNGRHAVVRFGTDWTEDAKRRDLTINALYCDRNGRIFDFVDGFGDIRSGVVRFIGQADERISEDALRILRFFRFFAWYGSGRPDEQGLKACSAARDKLSGLSAERVWAELKKLLGAANPGRALLWMRTTSILTALLPETEKWGIDSIPGLIELERARGWEPDALLRLMAMTRPHEESISSLSDRLSLSNRERERLVHWAVSTAPNSETAFGELEKLLYRGRQQGIVDAMKLGAVHLANRDNRDAAEEMIALIEHAQDWQKPVFPVSGKDLQGVGIKPGPEMGSLLKSLEERWIDSGFELERETLLAEINKSQ